MCIGWLYLDSLLDIALFAYMHSDTPVPTTAPFSYPSFHPLKRTNSQIMMDSFSDDKTSPWSLLSKPPVRRAHSVWVTGLKLVSWPKMWLSTPVTVQTYFCSRQTWQPYLMAMALDRAAPTPLTRQQGTITACLPLWTFVESTSKCLFFVWALIESWYLAKKFRNKYWS